MGVTKRRINDADYLYAVISKKQLYLGPAGGTLNEKHLNKATMHTDKTFEQALGRYSRDVLAYAALMDRADARKYLSECELLIVKYLDKLKKARRKQSA